MGSCLLFPNTNWTLREGEQWAIVGPSGSGKSMLAAAICGRATLAEGCIRYHFLNGEAAESARYGWFERGTVVHVGPDDHRRLAEQFSDYHQARWHASESARGATVSGLLTRQSVEAVNPFQVLEPLTEPDSFEQRRLETVRGFGLEGLLERRVHQLSNGETRKLVLARAVLRGPRLLVLDDPFGGLDVASRETLRQVIDELAARRMGFVIATSRPEELPSCIDRVLRVENHRVVSMLDRLPEIAAAPTNSGSPRFPADSVSTGDSRAEHGNDGDRTDATRGVPTDAAGRTRTPLIAMRDVSVSYGDVAILRGIDFTVYRGEHWALLGPNGAGKTTLLSLILADNPQVYANHVELFGRRRGTGESIWDIKSQIGWVSPEIHAHYPERARVIDVVCSGLFGSVGLFADCTTEQVELARACLDRFLPGVEERTLGELSYGRQRLVLIARALVANPALLILDEPCQGLDGHGRDLVRAAVEHAGEDGGATLLFVTHQPDELPSCIGHVLELRSGRVVRAGPRDPEYVLVHGPRRA